MTRLATICLTFAVLFITAGCSHIKTPAVAFTDDGEFLPQDVGEGLVRSPNPLIPDVPMPVGFKAVASQCSFQYDGNIRIVQHVYQGHAEPGDATEFYQRTLASNNWSLIDIQAVGNATVLRYTKGPEVLRITAKDGWAVSTITINIDSK
ncbi:MAG: hypothetical protein AB8C95_15390 [Phycisphaeraceae bacterium]